MEEDMIGYMDWLIEAEDVDEEGNKRWFEVFPPTELTVLARSISTPTLKTIFYVSEGAAIAKKKMMKKFGWYKHSEDGGGKKALFIVSDFLICFCYNLPTFIFYCLTESDSDDDIAYLDDDSGFCASLM